ncbi:MAG: SCO family protein [Rhizomicrobium sp.]
MDTERPARRRAVFPSAMLFAAMLLFCFPAQAGLTQAQLRSVGVFPPANAAVPPALLFHDTNGKAVRLGAAFGGAPAVLLFSDFACKTLCGPILTMTSVALAQSGLKPGRDFRLLVISLRANATVAEARAFVRPQLAAKIAGATRVLIGSAPMVAAATQALGYHYLYDPEHDQFAHPTAAFVLGGSGKLAAVLSAPGMRAMDVRLALLSAGTGAAATFADRLRLLCYCYDPATGIYSAAIGRLVDAVAATTLLALAGGIWLLRRKEVRGRA